MRSLRCGFLFGVFTIAACEPSIRDYSNSGGAGTSAGGMGGTGGTNSGGMAGIGGNGGTMVGFCGDNLLDPGEECDMGGVNTAECDSDCTLPACADGVFNPAAEACDDGDTADNGNGCTGVCTANSVCGDGIVQSFFEACDDGGQVDGDECSADCKQAFVSMLPVSDRGGGDFDNNGTFDALNQENSTGEAVAWVDPEERRIAFELDTSKLYATALVQSASFDFFTCCLSGKENLQLHGYPGDGAVELADMTADGLISEFLVDAETPRSIDVQNFMQGVAKSQWPFTGFLLRLATKPNALFNLGVQTSNNADMALRPRLKMTFCVDADHNGACD